MKKYLGIELGSTRIKAVLIDGNADVLCGGVYEWENKRTGGWWSYDLDEVWRGVQASYAELAAAYAQKYRSKLERLDGMGISGMMHGYLAFDGEYNLLAPFRTWRNTRTARAASELSEALDFHMPQRWSATHYFQAVLDREDHVSRVEHLHTLGSYVHYMLTDVNAVGANEASGMFPVCGTDFDMSRIEKYNALLNRHGVDKNLHALLPKIMLAGENAGTLTERGARLIDPSGNLKAGVPLCPPEGDMGTGMIATNCVRVNSANVSSGTSANITVVLERPLSRRYDEIDVIATPDGHPAALIHTNNCTSEIDEWVNLFGEVAALCGAEVSKGELYGRLFRKSAESDGDVGKITGYNYLAGEPLAGTLVGAPMILREADGKLNLANFMQMQIFSANAAIELGMDILRKEKVRIDSVTAHGGFYKTESIGQIALSAMLSAPVTVMKNAGEGGAYGIALLALYAAHADIPLADFLDAVFCDADRSVLAASADEKKKFAAYIARYKRNLPVERLCTDHVRNNVVK